jgi:hypothetical protein
MELQAHSQDLAPSDFHHLGLPKGAVGGIRYHYDDVKRMWCTSGYVHNQRLSIMLPLRSW